MAPANNLTMKTRRIIVSFMLVSSVLISCLAWWIHQRAQKRDWPIIHVKRAVTLALSLSDYHRLHGGYPESLTKLVDTGLMSEEEFQSLQFQVSPQSERQPWDYYPPAKLTDVAIVSPVLLKPWKDSDGQYITARPDGSGESFGRGKLRIVEALIQGRRKAEPTQTPNK